jgi:hypothetical protein
MSDEISIRKMEPVDAAGLAACIQRCYGDSYPKRFMYQPVELATRVRAGTYNGVVAIAGTEVVGHIGYNRPNPAATVVEAGTTVVDASLRGAGLMGRLAVVLRQSIVADGAAGFVHFPTTAHTVMQKASLQSGGCETGIMLAYLPSEARDLTIGGSGEDRLATTVEAPARTIFVPDRYHDLIAGFADHLRLRRALMRTSGEARGETKVQSTVDMHRKLERLTVEQIGKDIAEVVASATATSGATLIQIDIPMDQPEICHAVEALRAAGFGFAAWLPGWNDSDVLRLQLLRGHTTSELHPVLYSPAANALAELIRGELEGG